MAIPNRDRNLVVYHHWRDGKTVDETAVLTGIPRSTVGYYFRKFNRYAKMGIDPPAMIPSPQSPEEAYASAFSKISTIKQVFELLRTEEPSVIYYRLAGLKVAIEFINHLRLNVEERRQLPKLISDWISAMMASQRIQQQAGMQDRAQL